MEDIEESLEEEEVEEEAGESDEGGEQAPAPAAASDGEDVESIEDLLVKKEAREEEDDDSLLSLTREERLEPLAVKVVPPQPTEFICKNCYLVKHRSQLKDKVKMLCRDCA
jgi:Domain of unknown function (DUF4193)